MLQPRLQRASRVERQHHEHFLGRLGIRCWVVALLWKAVGVPSPRGRPTATAAAARMTDADFGIDDRQTVGVLQQALYLDLQQQPLQLVRLRHAARPLERVLLLVTLHEQHAGEAAVAQRRQRLVRAAVHAHDGVPHGNGRIGLQAATSY